MTDQATIETNTAAAVENPAPVPERPEFLPEQFWKDGNADLEALSGAYSELEAFKAVQDERAALIPSEAADYGFILPSDFAAPEGLEYAVDENDPRKDQLQAWAKDARVTKDDFSKLLAIQAQHEAGQIQQIQKTATAEMEKLGGNGAARIAGIFDVLKASLPEAQSKALADSLTTADAVRAVEKLIQKAAGGTPPTPTEQQQAEFAPVGRNASERLDSILLKGTN